MAKNFLFAVVEFTEELSVSVVPTTWLVSNRKHVVEKCYYPSFGGEKRTRDLVKSLSVHKKTWKSFPCRVLKFCQTFEDGLKDEEEAQYRSTWESEQEGSSKGSQENHQSRNQVLIDSQAVVSPPSASFCLVDQLVDQTQNDNRGASSPENTVDAGSGFSSSFNVENVIIGTTTTDELKALILDLTNKFESFQSFAATQFVKINEDIDALLHANPSVQKNITTCISLYRTKLGLEETGNIFQTDCKLNPELLSPTNLFKLFWTLNRHWMIQNVERMKDSGLARQWNSWIDFVLINKGKKGLAQTGREEMINELIDTARFKSVLAFVVVLYIVSLAALVVEILKNCANVRCLTVKWVAAKAASALQSMMKRRSACWKNDYCCLACKKATILQKMKKRVASLHILKYVLRCQPKSIQRCNRRRCLNVLIVKPNQSQVNG